MKRHLLSLAGALLASYALAACGRTELDVPEDVPDAHVVIDAPLDRPDTPDVPRVQCTVDRDCTDGLACNGVETCVAGRCLAGAATRCNDGVVCTVDRCVEGAGCVSTPDSTRCITPAFCDPMRDCTPVECVRDGDCDNGNVCDGAETCTGGRCARGPALSCDDGIACTVDQCSPARGCAHAPDDTRCDDGRFCDGVERCQPGVGCFVAMPVVCDDGDPCTVDACDEGRRACTASPTDADGDGFAPTSCPGGRDCDDHDRTVNPGAMELCLDGRDNNCDGRADCADLTCAGTAACGMCTPTGPEVCNDMVDNDCDRLADCADPDCAAAPACVMCVPTGPEADPLRCADGVDDDCNGLTDCADPSCRRLAVCMMCVPTGPESCNDGVDNDCNGSVDCADPGCATSGNCRTPNDTCGNALPLTLPGRVSGNTMFGHDDYTPACAGMGAPDVVYVFRNPTRQTITLDTEGSSYDTALIVFRGDCTSAPIACDDDSGTGTDSRVVLTDADPGTYFVVVDGWSNSRGAFQLNVNVGVREQCDNGVDDDGDGLVDCADLADCGALPACTMCFPRGPENNPMTCADGVDDDCDGFVDCADLDCRAVGACATCVPTGAEVDATACADGRDNDCDGLTDCADMPCLATTACMGAPPNDTCAAPTVVSVPSTTRASLRLAHNDFMPVTAGFPGCAGGNGPDVVYELRVTRPATIAIDTVGSTFDTVLYVRSSPCASGAQLACNDDANGVTSRVTFTATLGTYYVFADGFSAGATGDLVLNIAALTAEVCNNGRDDDGDGLVDCADSDCAADPSCACSMAPESGDAACSDGRDNDCDGFIDCADFDCASARGCCRPTGAEADATACADGRDDDCDGLVDCADPGCAAQPRCCHATAAREIGVAACTDGLDNDCDGVSDCNDSDCHPSAMSGGECCNGIDDNGNRVIDEFACACETSAQCAGVGSGGLFPSNTCWSTTYRLCAPRCDLLGGNLFCGNFFAGTTCNTTTGECVR